jgi:hypothetical protein
MNPILHIKKVFFLFSFIAISVGQLSAQSITDNTRFRLGNGPSNEPYVIEKWSGRVFVANKSDGGKIYLPKGDYHAADPSIKYLGESSGDRVIYVGDNYAVTETGECYYFYVGVGTLRRFSSIPNIKAAYVIGGNTLLHNAAGLYSAGAKVYVNYVNYNGYQIFNGTVNKIAKNGNHALFISANKVYYYGGALGINSVTEINLPNGGLTPVDIAVTDFGDFVIFDDGSVKLAVLNLATNPIQSTYTDIEAGAYNGGIGSLGAVSGNKIVKAIGNNGLFALITEKGELYKVNSDLSIVSIDRPVDEDNLKTVFANIRTNIDGITSPTPVQYDYVMTSSTNRPSAASMETSIKTAIESNYFKWTYFGTSSTNGAVDVVAYDNNSFAVLDNTNNIFLYGSKNYNLNESGSVIKYPLTINGIYLGWPMNDIATGKLLHTYTDTEDTAALTATLTPDGFSNGDYTSHVSRNVRSIISI